MGTRAGSQVGPQGDDAHDTRDARQERQGGQAAPPQTPPTPSADALGETKADLEALPDESAAGGSASGGSSSGSSAADIDLTEVYDRPEKSNDASLKRYDPEAGKMGLAVKLRAVRQRVDTPFGRVVMALALNLASLCLVIYTIAFPIWPLIAASALVVPACGWLLWWRYQQWLGYKRYMYRLLETLGEDVSDWNMEQTYRKPKVKRARR